MSLDTIRLSGRVVSPSQLVSAVIDSDGTYLQEPPASLSPKIRNRRSHDRFSKAKWEAYTRAESYFLLATAMVRSVRETGYVVPMVTMTMPRFTDLAQQREAWSRALAMWRRTLPTVLEEWGGFTEVRATEATVSPETPVSHVHRHVHSLLFMEEGIRGSDTHPEEIAALDELLRQHWIWILDRVLPVVTGDPASIPREVMKVTEYRCETAWYLFKDRGKAAPGTTIEQFGDIVDERAALNGRGFGVQELEEQAARGRPIFIKMLHDYHEAMSRLERITVPRRLEDLVWHFRELNARVRAERAEAVREHYECLRLDRSPWRRCDTLEPVVRSAEHHRRRHRRGPSWRRSVREHLRAGAENTATESRTASTPAMRSRSGTWSADRSGGQVGVGQDRAEPGEESGQDSDGQDEGSGQVGVGPGASSKGRAGDRGVVGGDKSRSETDVASSGDPVRPLRIGPRRIMGWQDRSHSKLERARSTWDVAEGRQRGPGEPVRSRASLTTTRESEGRQNRFDAIA